MSKLEKRYIEAGNVEVRALEGEDTLHGYFVVFDGLSVPIYEPSEGRFIERIADGAFDSSLQDRNVTALANHDQTKPLAQTKDGGLKIGKDDRGYWFSCKPVNTSWGRDTLEAVRSGLAQGMSFGFFVIADSWDKDEEGNKVRTVKEGLLDEVSVMVIGNGPLTTAYPDTMVAARTAAVVDEAEAVEVKNDFQEAPEEVNEQEAKEEDENEDKAELYKLDLQRKKIDILPSAI